MFFSPLAALRDPLKLKYLKDHRFLCPAAKGGHEALKLLRETSRAVFGLMKPILCPKKLKDQVFKDKGLF